MDPATLITAALTAGAAGATAGLTDVSKSGITSLYEQLKASLIHFFQEDSSAQKALECHGTNPNGYEMLVRDLLTESGAIRDGATLATARELLSLADPTGTQVGKYTTHVSGGNVGAVGDGAVVNQTFGMNPDTQ